MTDPKRFPSSFDKFWGKSEKKRQQTPDEIWSIFNAIIDAAEGQASGG